MPEKLLNKVETLCQLANGRGWGASSACSEVRCVSELVADSDIRFVIDVGANVGDWAVNWQKIDSNSKMLLVEPNHNLAQRLESMFSETTTISVQAVALGDRNGNGILEYPVGRESHGHISNSTRIGGQSSTVNYQSVTVRRLDDLLLEHKFPQPDIIKFDVEGSEWSAMSGAASAIEGCTLVQFEFGEQSRVSRVYMRDFWDFFNSLEFEMFRQTPRGPRPIRNYENRMETLACTNYFARKRR